MKSAARHTIFGAALLQAVHLCISCIDGPVEQASFHFTSFTGKWTASRGKK